MRIFMLLFDGTLFNIVPKNSEIFPLIKCHVLFLRLPDR